MNEQPSSKQPSMTLVVNVSLAFLLLLGYTLYRWDEAKQSPIQPTAISADWIKASGNPSYSGMFRKTFQFPGKVRHAWMVISACDAFEVSANRNPLSKYFLWRPTRTFQAGIGEKGQQMTSLIPAMAMNFPREYQWDGHDSYRVPVYVDFSHALGPGKNTICVEVESRRAPAKACFYGQITLWSGEVIELRSDESWRGEPVPIGLQSVDWRNLGYNDTEWNFAQLAQPPSGDMWRTLPEAIYTTPFAGKWMQHPSAGANEAVSFSTTFNVDTRPNEAWLRVVTNRRFDLFVNDRRVLVNAPSKTEMDLGQWVFGRQSGLDPIRNPELLDPDEIGSLFPGKRFESPRHSAPAPEMSMSAMDVKDNTRRRKRTGEVDSAQNTRPFDSTGRSLGAVGETHPFPDRLTPKSLTRDRSEDAYMAYSISQLLKLGENRISLRCHSPKTSGPLNWSARAAVDGGVLLKNGATLNFPEVKEWYCEPLGSPLKTSRGAETGLLAQNVSFRALQGRNLRVEAKGYALSHQSPLPPMQYRGIATTNDNVKASMLNWFCTALVGGLPLILVICRWCRLLVAPAMIVGSTTLVTGLLLESTYAERHERLLFAHPASWKWLLLITVIAMIASTIVDRLGASSGSELRSRVRGVSGFIKWLPETQIWRFAILWVLLLCALLRGYKLDFQPLDDDEYASTQAVLAIVETGLPKFEADKVYYTRSPLFHYFTAAVAWPFGADLWSLRMQSVGWSVLTAWLAYFCGSRLLRSSWVGFGAMFLVTVHPFEIYTGHVIRFYQMQQFFALLTVYLFCRGFVDGRPKWRYWTIGVFLAAVLSQEISAVMGVSLALGYLIFGKDLGWHHNIRLITLAGVAIICIALDFLVFQTRCLTRVEGISPNLEASVKPHFWQPYNFLALYISYSRLHLMLSVFLLVGLPLAWRQRNRNALAFHFFLISGVVMTNLLVTHVSLRYQYWLFPIWILLGLDSIRVVLAFVIDRIYDPLEQVNRHRWNISVCASIAFVGIVLSWSPWRIPGSYETKILGDSTGAFRYVRGQLRDGDKVAATEPHTHAGFLEAGQIDYDISVPLLYDFAVFQDGKLVDRNGGGELVGSLDEMIKVFSHNDRVWLLLNREKFRTRGKNLRWEYPGARFELFLRKNCELRHRTYLWSVYLWDASRGHHIPFRQHSG